jgi:hypothetical protein
MNIPCKTCITLSICKSFYTSHREISDIFGTGTRRQLEKKCSIIKNWLHFSFSVGVIPENVKELHRFFRGTEE